MGCFRNGGHNVGLCNLIVIVIFNSNLYTTIVKTK